MGENRPVSLKIKSVFGMLLGFEINLTLLRLVSIALLSVRSGKSAELWDTSVKVPQPHLHGFLEELV